MEKDKYTNNDNKFIFDMDGTLYHFDGKPGQTFSDSLFYRDLKQSAYSFFMGKLNISEEQAQSTYNQIKEKYNGQLSIGVEKEFGIDRYEYFDNTWDLNPELYIQNDKDITEMMEQLCGRVALLTAAPRVWALNVLKFLDIDDIFENRIYTGEADIRKPNPEAFNTIIRDFNTTPQVIFSIGDQEFSDIAPAKSLGLQTVIVGPDQLSADYRIDKVTQLLELIKGEGFI